MFIKGIGIEIEHSVESENNSDAPSVCFPNDWQAWVTDLQASIEAYRKIQIAISSTASPTTIAIAIGPVGMGGNAENAFNNSSAFGFVVNLATLRHFRAAIEAAIVTLEE